MVWKDPFVEVLQIQIRRLEGDERVKAFEAKPILAREYKGRWKLKPI